MTNQNTGPHPAIRAAHPGSLVFYILMMSSWLLDFQSEGAGEGLKYQIFFLISYIASTALFLFAHAPNTVNIPGIKTLAVCTLLFVGVSATSGFLDEQEAYSILRHSLTIFIYFTSAYATAQMVATNSATVLRHALATLCLGYAVSTFLIMMFAGQEIDVEIVRYEIEGASSIAALGMLVLALVFNISVLELAAGVAAAIVIFLSITRTYLVSLAVQGGILLPIVFRTSLMHALSRLLLICAPLIVALTVFGHTSLERWTERLFISQEFGGEDPTFVTRSIEWSYMWEEFLSSYQKFFFGSGLAAETQWWLPNYFGQGDAVSTSVGFGHNQHLSLLFAGGLVGGLPLLLLHLFQGWQGFRFLTQARQHMRGEAKTIYFLGAWGAVIVAGYLANNILSACFGNRGSALWYGIGTGLLLGARSCLLPSSRRSGK